MLCILELAASMKDQVLLLGSVLTTKEGCEALNIAQGTVKLGNAQVDLDIPQTINAGPLSLCLVGDLGRQEENSGFGTPICIGIHVLTFEGS
jgi:hypothetical protein